MSLEISFGATCRMASSKTTGRCLWDSARSRSGFQRMLESMAGLVNGTRDALTKYTVPLTRVVLFRAFGGEPAGAAVGACATARQDRSSSLRHELCEDVVPILRSLVAFDAALGVVLLWRACRSCCRA